MDPAADRSHLQPIAPPGEDELPYDDGEPLESARHRDQMIVLIDTLKRHLADRDDVYVGGNEFVYFSETQTRKNDFRGPDVFVVLDTVRRERKSWVAWREGGRLPDVVIEITSDTTRHVDVGGKMRIYARVFKAPSYCIYDPDTGELDAFSLDPENLEYRPAPRTEAGRVSCKLLRLELGVVPGEHDGAPMAWLRWFTPDGKLLPTDAEVAGQAEEQRRQAEELRRQAEEQRRRAEERAQTLENRLAAYEQRFGSLDGDERE